MRISDWSSDVCSSDLRATWWLRRACDRRVEDMQPIRNLWRDRSGAFAPISALVLTVIIGFGALTIDMGYNYVMRNRLQVTADAAALAGARSEEHTSELQSLMRTTYADFCLKKKKTK